MPKPRLPSTHPQRWHPCGLSSVNAAHVFNPQRHIHKRWRITLKLENQLRTLTFGRIKKK